MGFGMLLANHQAVKKAMSGHRGNARNHSSFGLVGIARTLNHDAVIPGTQAGFFKKNTFSLESSVKLFLHDPHKHESPHTIERHPYRDSAHQPG